MNCVLVDCHVYLHILDPNNNCINLYRDSYWSAELDQTGNACSVCVIRSIP